MRIVPSLGAAKLLSRAANVNDKKNRKTSRAAAHRATMAQRSSLGETSGPIPVPVGAPKFLPPAGENVILRLNPNTVPAETLDGPDAAAPVAFTLRLTRPARADGGASVALHEVCDPHPGDMDVALLSLQPGQPYEVALDGRPVLRCEGDGWHGQKRAVVTIRAAASPAMLARLCVVSCSDDPGRDWLLAVFIAAGQLGEVRLDGELATPRR